MKQRETECCTPNGQIKRYKDCIGCDKKPLELNQNKMKQTAVEWLESELKNSIGMPYKHFEEIINQAKEMENEQQSYSEKDLREAFRQGENNVGYNSKYGYTFKSTEKEWFKQFKKK